MFNRWHHGALHSLRRLSFPHLLAWLFAACVWFSGDASAALRVTPMSLGSLAPSSSGGLSGMATYQATTGTGSAANSAYYARAVSFSQGQVANAARARAVPGVGAGSAAAAAAVSAAMLGAGYLLDQYTGQINSAPAIPAPPLGPVTWELQDGSLRRFNAYMDSIGTVVGANTISAYIGPGGVNSVFMRSVPHGSAVLVSSNTPANPVSGYVDRPAVPATDAQVAQAILNNPNTWPYLFTNPNTGAVQNTGPIADGATALYNELAPGVGIDPVVTPKPTPTTGEQTGDQPAPTEWPSFCAWATRVCSFFDWAQEPPVYEGDPPLEIEEAPAPDTSAFNSGLGAGTCPAPREVAFEMMGTSSVFPIYYEPLCDLAAILKPLAIALALVLAAFHIGAFKR